MTSKKIRLFMSGNSQAVRIPREFQLDGDEVEIQRRDNTLVIRPKKQSWAPFISSLGKIHGRLYEGRSSTTDYPKAEVVVHMKVMR